jgi:hypothetical protein
MRIYENISGKSGVVAYEIGEGCIWIQFAGDAEPYLYTNESAGAENIRTMQDLARAGKNLATFVSRHVKTDYVKRPPKRPKPYRAMSKTPRV